MTETSVAEATVPERPASRWRVLARIALVVGLVCFAAFWVWALFFASKEPINRIGDRAWAARAEASARCAALRPLEAVAIG
jgi:membrane protein YdbS with pleckstrin-like domain